MGSLSSWRACARTAFVSLARRKIPHSACERYGVFWFGTFVALAPPRGRQLRFPGGARVLDAGRVVEELALPVGRHAERVQPECDRRRIDVGAQLARRDR